MAVDKLVDSTQLDADLTSVANAIRTKGGTSAQLAFPDGFVAAIDAIETGGQIDLDYGEVVLAADSQTVSLQTTKHRTWIFVMAGNADLAGLTGAHCFYAVAPMGGLRSAYRYYSSTASGNTSASVTGITLNISRTAISVKIDNSSRGFQAGIKYHLYAGGEDTNA